MSPKPFSDPVLLLASNGIGKLGTLDADNLSCIWTGILKVFLENGRRLENLSWRLWYRTTHLCSKDNPFCTDKGSECHTNTLPEFSRDKNLDMPELSASVDSVSSVDEHEVKGKIQNYRSSNMHMLVQESSKKPKTIQYVSPGRFQKIIMDLTREYQHCINMNSVYMKRPKIMTNSLIRRRFFNHHVLIRIPCYHQVHMLQAF